MKHAAEVKHLTEKVQEMRVKHEMLETKHSEEMAAIEGKLEVLLRVMLNQSNSGHDMGDLVALLSTPNENNNALHSSASAHALNNHAVCFPYSWNNNFILNSIQISCLTTIPPLLWSMDTSEMMMRVPVSTPYDTRTTRVRQVSAVFFFVLTHFRYSLDTLKNLKCPKSISLLGWFLTSIYMYFFKIWHIRKQKNIFVWVLLTGCIWLMTNSKLSFSWLILIFLSCR